MEFIVLSLGYFALLGCMVYKGADLPSILGAAGLYVTSYLGLRKHADKSKFNVNNKKEKDGK